MYEVGPFLTLTHKSDNDLKRKDAFAIIESTRFYKHNVNHI